MKFTAKFKYHNTIVDVEFESRTWAAASAAYSECVHKIEAGEVEHAPAAITAFMTDEVKQLEEMAETQ